MLTNVELARKFNRSYWDGPISVLTRKALAKELNVSERTLRRWEQKGIIKRPFNCMQGAGRGNKAVYKDPMEGIVSILTNDTGVFIRYKNGRLRWRKRRSQIVEEDNFKDKEENHELV